jgi:hypothetical protein
MVHQLALSSRGVSYIHTCIPCLEMKGDDAEIPLCQNLIDKNTSPNTTNYIYTKYSSGLANMYELIRTILPWSSSLLQSQSAYSA